ncbi:hypothetical protein [Streptomyces chromofuscus]|uniref:Small hydrophilic protein n=1 Tax=Streptomyces chromofuscus TaxID=42881 RepID=A0A7M2TFU2_STRCW|nr:hypothetical protein [Streptomyces chromofuscus]QOV46141.1 hypothetical protein IPT68_09645 [Streptomyces chromofuscus]GGT13147.1 hypothetical protein GCM10010254_37380 [Streptomyces chromofuscus]
MAKNKNRDRKQQHTGRAQQQSEQSAAEPMSEQHAAQPSPIDGARKGRQKRFGHN